MKNHVVFLDFVNCQADKPSSHTDMDMTETFMQEATDFFLEENLPRFVRERVLLNPVDPVQGY